MMACKKNVYGRYAGLFLLAGCLLAGCASTQKKIEKEEAYRKIGISERSFYHATRPVLLQ